MPHAAFTAAAPAERAASLPLPPATAKLRGDLNLRLAPGLRQFRSRPTPARAPQPASLPPTQPDCAPPPIARPKGHRRPVQPRRSNHPVLIP
jgi:hypothetical protein